MSDSPLELDLKFLPDWLKESPSKNQYADFEGETRAPGRSRDDRHGPPGRRPQGRGESRGPRPTGGGGRDDRGGDRRQGKGGGSGKPRPQQGRWEDRGPRAPRPEPEAPRAPVVRVEVLPEPLAAAGIAKQIKTSGRACGVFRVAKMFLERSERFCVRVTALDPAAVMYRIGDGPLSFDRAAVERGAFKANMDQFYVVETVQGDPPKGNYTSVARERLSGALLGPPNHHGYQPALRKLYEERYSRRMSFPDFQRNIDIVTDPAAVEQWKQQSSSVTTIKTKVAEGEEALVFKNEAEAEQHFRATHLPPLLKSGNSMEVPGLVGCAMLDRNIGFAVRDSVERERFIPVGMVNALRPYFNKAGLHLFKWRKKVLFASAIRPQRHPADQVFSEGIAAILTTIGEHPGIKRPDLAARLVVVVPPDAPESAVQDATAGREALAADLHYLIQVGHVVEFQNGTLELPAARRESAHAETADDDRHDVAAETAELRESKPVRAAAKPAEAKPAEAKPAEAKPAEAHAEGAVEPQSIAAEDYQALPLLSAAGVAGLL